MKLGYLGLTFTLALTFAVSSCSNPSQTAAVQPTTPPTTTATVASVVVAVTVSNTHFGTAVPADFKLSVHAGGREVGVVNGDPDGVSVTVDRGAAYAVSVATGPGGYTNTQTSACSGTADPSQQPRCVVTLQDVVMSCDDTFWNPVYLKTRLKVLSACEIATGIVQGFDLEPDGDLLILIKPDASSTRLLRPGNSYRDNNLVLEVPCQCPVTQASATGACGGYKVPTVTAPEIGTHIIAAAHWVEDTNHYSWGELHGARITVLPR
jgi:hypothetical protein